MTTSDTTTPMVADEDQAMALAQLIRGTTLEPGLDSRVLGYAFDVMMTLVTFEGDAVSEALRGLRLTTGSCLGPARDWANGVLSAWGAVNDHE